MLNKIEDSLIRRLRDSLPDAVEVIPLPDTVEGIARPFATGQICVYYAGLNGRPQPSTTGSIESRRQIWQLLLRHRHRRQDGGLHGLIDSARYLLTGFLPAGAAGRLQLEEESVPEPLDGVWASFLTLSCPVPVLHLEDPEAGPRLVRLEWEGQIQPPNFKESP